MSNLLKDYLTDKQKALLWDSIIETIINCDCDNSITYGKVLDCTITNAKIIVSNNLEQVKDYIK
jgi:hypothetical protein